ncbi:DUF1499 domain-containing protein [Altererythrobacter aquiaggeris]|uniref:DUF1499 domain-containing protein n=1 Tax=Aestuarierythrobacter aquiaggeris TaxID=1898396 RepID=UPI0030166C9F
MKKAPWYARLALILALLLPVYFMAAALGTKFGLWDWKTGLITLTVTAGPIIIGGVALVALISLIVCLVKKPRTGWLLALIALLIPAGMMAMAASVRAGAGDIPPIHDIATDVANPPQFPAATVAAREASGANPLRAFDVPLGQYDVWKDADSIKDKTNAEVIAENYPQLGPVTLQADRDAATKQVADAMRGMGFADVAADVAADGSSAAVSGVAETFWFGFKDDVTARVTPGPEGTRVDFRSTSRVGLSDLGANAERIAALSAKLKKGRPQRGTGR